MKLSGKISSAIRTFCASAQLLPYPGEQIGVIRIIVICWLGISSHEKFPCWVGENLTRLWHNPVLHGTNAPTDLYIQVFSEGT